MRFNVKRAWAGVAAMVVAASAAPLFNPTAAFAAGTLQGAVTVRNAGNTANLNSGDSSTNFALALPTGAACGGDTANNGYVVQTYMVPGSVDPSTLTFDANGPLPFGTGASFRQPLYDTASAAETQISTQPAASPPGPGVINSPLPAANFAVFAPGDIPAGAYNVGVACTQGGASATQMKEFWNTQMTFATSASGGPAQVTWVVGGVPSAPTLTSVTPGNGSLTATFTATPSTPATTGFTATATPTGGGTAVTGTGAASPVTISGLTNGTSYNVTVHATNSAGNSVESNMIAGMPAVPANAPVANLTATPGANKVDLSWNAPTSGPAPTGYTVTYTPGGGTPASPISVAAGANPRTQTVTGLTAGTAYTFTVTPVQTGTATPANVMATPTSAAVIMQDVTVNRPVGALVLTQVCGVNAAFPADPTVSLGFPAGVPAVAAGTTATAPTPVGAGEFAQYPYPTDANGVPNPTYSTHCGINLGKAKFVTSGTGAGLFFATSGVINQVTVVDTRDNDPGWAATGSMSRFVNAANSSKSFSGSQLGWGPAASGTSPSFTDSDGNTYDQVTAAGGVVAPNTPSASGLSINHNLGTAASGAACIAGTPPTNCTGGLGIALFDARLKLLIPVTAVSGDYNGTLTLTVS